MTSHISYEVTPDQQTAVDLFENTNLKVTVAYKLDTISSTAVADMDPVFSGEMLLATEEIINNTFTIIPFSEDGHLNFILRRTSKHILSACSIPTGELFEYDVSTSPTGSSLCEDYACKLRSRLRRTCRGHLNWLSNAHMRTAADLFSPSYRATGEAIYQFYVECSSLHYQQKRSKDTDTEHRTRRFDLMTELGPIQTAREGYANFQRKREEEKQEMKSLEKQRRKEKNSGADKHHNFGQSECKSSKGSRTTYGKKTGKLKKIERDGLARLKKTRGGFICGIVEKPSESLRDILAGEEPEERVKGSINCLQFYVNTDL